MRCLQKCRALRTMVKRKITDGSELAQIITPFPELVLLADYQDEICLVLLKCQASQGKRDMAIMSYYVIPRKKSSAFISYPNTCDLRFSDRLDTFDQAPDWIFRRSDPFNHLSFQAEGLVRDLHI